MWKYKEFKTYSEQQRWILDNQHKYQIENVFIENFYALEYRKLRRVY